MMKWILVVAALLCMTSVSEAAHFRTVRHGRVVVAHTRLAPVIVHRALPPYGLGRHVYMGHPVYVQPVQPVYVPPVYVRPCIRHW